MGHPGLEGEQEREQGHPSATRRVAGAQDRTTNVHGISPQPWSDFPEGVRYAAGADALSRREREIVALTMAGETAPAIAKALFLSERTVESHLARAYAKLGVHSKLELARRASELGLASDSP